MTSVHEVTTVRSAVVVVVTHDGLVLTTHRRIARILGAHVSVAAVDRRVGATFPLAEIVGAEIPVIVTRGPVTSGRVSTIAVVVAPVVSARVSIVFTA